MANRDALRPSYSGNPACEPFTSLTDISFRGYCPRSELPQPSAPCHLGAVTQSPGVPGSTVPNSLINCRPPRRAVTIGPDDTKPARIVRRFDCGLANRPE